MPTMTVLTDRPMVLLHLDRDCARMCHIEAEFGYEGIVVAEQGSLASIAIRRTNHWQACDVTDVFCHKSGSRHLSSRLTALPSYSH